MCTARKKHTNNGMLRLHSVTHVRIGKNTVAVHCTNLLNLFGQKKSNRKRRMKSNLERKMSWRCIYVRTVYVDIFLFNLIFFISEFFHLLLNLTRCMNFIELSRWQMDHYNILYYESLASYLFFMPST